MKTLSILGYDFSDWSEEMFEGFMNAGWHYYDENEDCIWYDGQSVDDFIQFVNYCMTPWDFEFEADEFRYEYEKYYSRQCD